VSWPAGPVVSRAVLLARSDRRGSRRTREGQSQNQIVDELGWPGGGSQGRDRHQWSLL